MFTVWEHCGAGFNLIFFKTMIYVLLSSYVYSGTLSIPIFRVSGKKFIGKISTDILFILFSSFSLGSFFRKDLTLSQKGIKEGCG